MVKKYIIFLVFFVLVLFFTAILYAESGVLLLLNTGKKYFIPSNDIDYIEFIYEKSGNNDQNNSQGFHVNTNVNFNYKYHIQNQESESEDWFDAQVGTVCLYVFNDKDEFLFQREMINAGGEDLSNNRISFTEEELKPGETYKLGAFALGNKKGYENSLLSPGYRLVNNMVPLSSKIEDLILKLDSDKDDFGNSVVNYKEWFEAKESELDTLWITQPGNIITLSVPQTNNYSTSTEDLTLDIDVPLMRITKSIKINLISDTFNKDTNEEDYEFVIEFPKGNDLIGLYGDIIPNGFVEYHPLRQAIKKWSSNRVKYKSEGENGVFFQDEDNADNDSGLYSISADFGISRMMIKDKSVLKIINKSTGKVIHPMIEGFSDFFEDIIGDRNNQEFLDRESVYSMDLRINDQDICLWMEIGCESMDYKVRINFLDF